MAAKGGRLSIFFRDSSPEILPISQPMVPCMYWQHEVYSVGLRRVHEDGRAK